MIPFLLTLVLFSVIGGGVFLVIFNQKKQQRQRLQRLIQGKQADTKNAGESLEDQQNKRRAEIAKKLKGSGDDEELDPKKKKRTPIKTLLARAGLGISPAQYFMFSTISAAIMLGLGLMLSDGIWVPVLLLITGFFGVPRFVLRNLTNRRQKNFLSEFPDALEAMVRLLKAGMPIAESISMISREFTGPIGDEMTRIYNKQKIGIPLHEAALEATERMPLPEVKMFATGLAIQAQTGSSMSEVLTNLAGVIRARFKLKRKIKALSSEAIASAGIIGSLPILLSLGLYFSNREYIMVLFEDSFGQILLGGAVTWMFLGCVVMKQMINFKI